MEMPCVSISGKRKVMLNRFCRKPLYEVTRTLAYISLACIPELRLTNRGLVDCRTFRFADLFPS